MDKSMRLVNSMLIHDSKLCIKLRKTLGAFGHFHNVDKAVI